MIAGDRLRLRPADRPNRLLLELGSDAFGELNVGRGKEIVLRLGDAEYELMTGDGWDVVLRTPDGTAVAEHDDRRLRDDLIVADGRGFPLSLPKEDKDGELRDGRGRRIARLEMRHPEHGSVLLVEVLADVPDLVLSFAAAIAYMRCGSVRRVRRFGEQHVQAPVSIGVFTAGVAAGECSLGGGFDNP